jgi:hypothetical protein
VAFYPDAIGEANSFAASIESQPRFYGKAVRSGRSGRFAFCTRSAFHLISSFCIFPSDFDCRLANMGRIYFCPGQRAAAHSAGASQSHAAWRWPGEKKFKSPKLIRLGGHPLLLERSDSVDAFRYGVSGCRKTEVSPKGKALEQAVSPLRAKRKPGPQISSSGETRRRLSGTF